MNRSINKKEVNKMNSKTLIGAIAVSVMLVSSVFAADVDTMGGKWGVGLFGTTPTVRINFTDVFSTQIGVAYQTPGSNTTGSRPGQVSTLLLLSFKNHTFGEGGKIAMNWGILGRYSSNNGFVSGNTSTDIGITMGAETLVNPNFIVGLTIIPIIYSSNVTGGGATSNNNWGFFNEAVVTGHIMM